MKNNQHKDFDNFFQNKLNDRQFEFKDDFWDEMETLLPKNDTDLTPVGNNRKRLVWGILLLCLVGFTGWLVYPNTNIRLSADERKNVNENLENANVNVITENLNFENKNNQLSKTEKQNTTSNTNFEAIQQPNIHQEKNKNNSIINQKSTANSKEFGESQIKSNPKIEKQNVGNSIIYNENAIEITKGDIGKEVNYNVKSIDKNGWNIENDRLTAPTLPIIFNENKNNSEKENIENIGTGLNKNEVLKPVFLLTKPIAVETENIKKDITQAKPNCDGCPIKPSFHSLKVGLSAGLSVSQGFKNAMELRAKPSFDPTVGLSLSYRHSPISDWSVNAGVLYASRSSLNAQIGYESTTYGFGAKTISRTINIEELHYINVPIYAVYTKKQHQFMGGLTANYLLNAQSTTQGTIETLNYDATEFATEAATQQWGYTTAFNRLDVGLALGYDYQVAEGWKVGTRINYGLMDVAKDNVFNRPSFDNNLNIRILLTCDLKKLAF